MPSSILQSYRNVGNMLLNLRDAGGTPATGCKSGYPKMRKYHYKALGEVSYGINLTSPEYYGDKAAGEIMRVAERMDFKTEMPALCIRAAKPVS